MACGCGTLLTRTQSETHASRRVAKCRSPSPVWDIIPSLAESTRKGRQPLTTVCPPPTTSPAALQHLLHLRPPPPPQIYNLSLPLLSRLFRSPTAVTKVFNFPFAFYLAAYQKWTVLCLSFLRLFILTFYRLRASCGSVKMAPSSTLVSIPLRSHDLSSMKSPIFGNSLPSNSHRRCRFFPLSREIISRLPSFFCATHPCSALT